MDSPSEPPDHLKLVSNPNYELTTFTAPIQFQEDIEKRANELNKPETVIGPLQTGSWGIVAAPPGVGKSMWMAALIGAIAGKTRRAAGDWIAPHRRGVLLVDAEMSPSELAGRYAQYDLGEWCGFCDMDLIEQHDQDAFSLGNREHQLALMKIGHKVDVVIIDNIEYTLDPADGHNIWSPETWKQVAPLTKWAKTHNKLLILVDHTNKEGNVQGSLSKQRGASFVITLEPEYIEGAEPAFIAHFAKYRAQLDDPKLKRDRTWYYKGMDWYCEIKPTLPEQVIELAGEDMTQTDIAKALGIRQGTVSKILKKNKNLL